MNKKIQNFLDIMAGLRDDYYKKDRQLKALQKYIKESEVKNYKPQVIDVGLTQQELIEIDREMLYLLAKQLEDKIREIEIRITQTTISNTIKENN